MKDVNPNLPMFYERTGQPVELLRTEPLMQYRVRYSNGNEALLTGPELERQMTNAKPRYRFMKSYNGGFMKVSGNEDTMRFTVASPPGSFGKAQDLDVNDVQDLAQRMNDWLADRDRLA